jgi:hypothetical protein
MRIDIANNLKIGDIIFNCFMDELIVTSIHKDIKSQQVFFGTVDTRLNKQSYNFRDVYDKDFTDESDDEKAWVNWAQDNRDFFDEFDHIETMREVYKTAFCHGFEHKQRIKFEEAMQK